MYICFNFLQFRPCERSSATLVDIDPTNSSNWLVTWKFIVQLLKVVNFSFLHNGPTGLL